LTNAPAGVPYHWKVDPPNSADTWSAPNANSAPGTSTGFAPLGSAKQDYLLKFTALDNSNSPIGQPTTYKLITQWDPREINAPINPKTRKTGAEYDLYDITEMQVFTVNGIGPVHTIIKASGLKPRDLIEFRKVKDDGTIISTSPSYEVPAGTDPIAITEVDCDLSDDGRKVFESGSYQLQITRTGDMAHDAPAVSYLRVILE
jgi:hypothetical protein